MNMQPVFVEDMPNALAGVDEKGRIYLPPAFVDSLNKTEREFVVCHEVMHLAMMHLLRRGSRINILWNFATDLTINDTLREAGMTAPKGTLYDKELSRDDQNRIDTGENIYRKLEKNTTIEYVGWDEHIENGGSGDIKDGDGQPLPAGMAPEEIKRKIKEAVEATKSRGKLPAGLEEYLDDVIAPKIGWKTLLYRFITTVKGDEVNWSKRNNTMRQAGYFPTYESEQLEDIVFAIDTSGSLSQEQLTQFMSEVAEVLTSCEVKNLHVIQCDADVQSHDIVQTGDLKLLRSMKVKGRGGTDFDPVFKYVEANGIKPAVLIYLTDGAGFCSVNPPPFPVLWIVDNDGGYINNVVKFGEIIVMDK
jgi:predicted metal-dependent peptidase